MRRGQRYLLRICFTSWTSHESFLLYGLILVLLLRSVLSVFVAEVDGQLVKQVINRDRRQIVLGVLMWIGVAIPSSLINSVIKYLQSRLSLAMRAKLTEFTRKKFFDHKTYFRITQLRQAAEHAGADSGNGQQLSSSSSSVQMSEAMRSVISHPESVLTEDVTQWAERFTDLLSSVGKPLVDLAFLSGILYSRLGFFNQFTASVLVWETGNLLRLVRPDFGKLVQEKQDLEAELRSQHTRIIAASEEIAFCRGEEREKKQLSSYFDRIASHTRTALRKQILYNAVEDFVTKYLWSAIGMIQVALPLLKSGTNAGDNAKYFITLRRIMVRNGDAVERCLGGIKDAIEFNAFTVRVMNLLSASDEIVRQGLAAEAATLQSAPSAAQAETGIALAMRHVNLQTPTGALLTKDVNLELAEGDRLLILGPNGCGKTSLFRVLSGLWNCTEGSILKPEHKNDLFFVPQRPYLVVGTLRDQIIYPDTEADMKAKGFDDNALLTIVDLVLMRGPVEAHGGLNSVKEWDEVLSGGEKQRLGLARVFYQRPKFAILDECTSAVNVEAERDIFEAIVARKIGLLTITHRKTLLPFHTKLLAFDGEGGCHVANSIAHQDFASRSAKKAALVVDLQRVLRELGEDWPKNVQQALSGSSA